MATLGHSNASIAAEKEMKVMTTTLPASTRAHRAELVFLCAVVLAFPAAATAATCERDTQKVEFNHTDNNAVDDSVVSLKVGARFQLKILATYSECFEYSYQPIDLPASERAAPGGVGTDDVCLPPIVHDGEPRDYLVFITKKSPYPLKCSAVTLVERGENNPWVVPVRTFEWAVGFAGGFMVDGLADPSYGLVEMEREVGGMTEKGFRVIRQRERDDDYSLGASAMVHVFHTDPDKFWGVPWTPITFGLAVNNGSDVRYFLGTSLRFSDQAFLSAGAVFGGRDRLPPGLDLGDNSFTTNANALNNLDSRTDAAWFVGVSYAFLGDKAKSAFEGAISTPTGTPSRGGKPAAAEKNGSGDGGTVKITGPEEPLKLTSPRGEVQGAKIPITLASGAETTVSFTLKGAQKDFFVLSRNDCELKTDASTCELVVTPKVGLAAGMYAATVVATPESGDPVMVSLELTVESP